ncbi:MAG TPA: ATP-binding protein [Verrucomicrobiae bacterium]|nr:ATP-binding protein [Verrucomicrobiae bacterium]
MNRSNERGSLAELEMPDGAIQPTPEAPQQTEELYRQAITGAGAVPYFYDFSSGSYTFMGEGVEDLIGYKPKEVNPELWRKIIRESVMLGETSGLSREEAARRVQSGEVRQWRCDMHITTRAGKSRWIGDTSVQSFNESGFPTCSVGVLQDITERKHAEISAVAFSKLGQELFSATTLEAAARIIARVADELFGWDAFSLYLYAPETDQVCPVFECDTINGRRMDVTSKGMEHPSQTCRRVLHKGAELILKEGLEPNAKPYGDVTRPSACIMRVPLRVKSKSTGVLAIHSYTPGAYGANNLNFLQTLADYCSGAFERIWAEESVRNLHKQLLETSRLAGMAEVATSVLHNVGNVLNSVNVSASVIGGKVRNSRVVNLGKAVDLMHAHKDDLAAFLADDARGRELPGYLSSLAVHLMDEQTQILGEVASLSNYVEHIKDIVAMQQNYARVSGVTESLNVIDLVEDAIRMNRGALERHNVKLVRDYQGAVPVNVDKHKALQILVNLIRNAKYALDDGEPPEKILTIRVTTGGDDRVKISVADNGVGIPAENLVRIFGHGFTTRKTGHGFGLHSGALAAKEMGGSLSVQSDGWGKGATFTLEFPRNPTVG